VGCSAQFPLPLLAVMGSMLSHNESVLAFEVESFRTPGTFALPVAPQYEGRAIVSSVFGRG
jgi:hypothetical protein